MFVTLTFLIQVQFLCLSSWNHILLQSAVNWLPGDKRKIWFNVHGSVHRINILLHVIPTRYTIHRVYFYLTTALHVSGITVTHRQEHKTTVTTASGNRYTVLLSVVIVEELELI